LKEILALFREDLDKFLSLKVKAGFGAMPLLNLKEYTIRELIKKVLHDIFWFLVCLFICAIFMGILDTILDIM